jgi:membrane associated rhomboid family serine protease
MPPVVKNLLIINGIFYLATFLLAQRGIDLVSLFGMHIIGATDFKPWQIITYMFVHGSFGHIFFNMFALWMFGAVIENSLGSRRFLFYYLVTGIGAAIIHYTIIYFQIHPTSLLINQFLDHPSLETYRLWAENNTAPEFKTMVAQNWAHLQYNPDSLVELINITFTARNNYLNGFVIIGASGSVFGLLLAFGMMFPNSKIYIYFLLPIKAKWFVVIYGAIELVYGVAGTADGIGHFAHLGGMLFGFILLMIWRKKREI